MKKMIFSLFMASLFLVAVTTPGWAPDPCIDIEKLVSVDGGKTFVDADDCDKAPTTGGPAEYKLIVKNCGNTDLPKVFINDSELGIVDFLVGFIDAGDSKTFTKDDISELSVKDVCEPDTEFFDNTATAEDRFWNVYDSDSACVKCEEPKLCSIGDFVWFDENQDGCQDPDKGIEGATVCLYKDADCDNPGAGVFVDCTETDSEGFYLFDNLDCGQDYEIEFVTPDGLSPTTPNQECTDNPIPGDSDENDSDCKEGERVCVSLVDDTIVENLTIDCGLVTPCGLTLEKGCEIPPPAPPAVGKCEGKLQQFTVIWNGANTIDIAVGEGLTGASATSAAPGDEVTFFTDGSTNDTIVNISGVGISGQSTFHVSCSDKDMDGDTTTNEDQQQVSPVGRDCGKDQGDGKGDSGFINQWLLEGFVDKDGAVLDCTVDDDIGDDSCSFQAVAADCDFPKEDPDILTFRISGGGCSASDNNQKPDKTECTGGFINPDQAVDVSVNGDPRFPLQPGETFDVERGGDPEIELFQGNVTQFNKFHASCSQPLQAGDRYGANELVALDGAGLGTNVVYSYRVGNNGPGDLTGITVTDDPLGPVPGSPIALLEEGDSETLTATAFIAETTTNTATAIASPTCAADSNQVEVEVLPPPPCDVSIAFKELKEDAIKWTLTNDSTDSKATMNTFNLEFPAAYGLIKEVKLDGAIFKASDSTDPNFSGGAASGQTIGPNDWTEDEVAKRQLDRGEGRTLEVKFTNKSKDFGPDDFTLVLTFEEGCNVSF